MPRALMLLRAIRTLVVLLSLVAHFACAMPAYAQPATRELRAPKGVVQLDGRLFFFGDDGTAGTLAWIEEGRDMLPLEDGVLVAGTNLALYGYTLLTDEAQPDGGSTPPLWKADLTKAALATDGTSPLALGTPPASAAVAGKRPTLIVMRRAADGSWTTEATNIPLTQTTSVPSDVSVDRVVWAGDRWLAALSREAPAKVVAEIRAAMETNIRQTVGIDATELARIPNRFFHAEIWQSTDGRTWTQTELPTRAQHAPDALFEGDLELAGANQVFLASIYGRLYRADPSLRWREIATPLGEGMPVTDLHYADGRFLAHGNGWIATSTDAVSWSTWNRNWNFSVSENGPHVTNGSFRWFSNEDPPRNLTLDEAVASKTSLEEAPPAAPEIIDFRDARLFAPDPTGTVAVAGEHLCRRNPDGTITSGIFVGRTTSLAAGVDGIALANNTLRFVSYDALNATQASLALVHTCVARDQNGVAAIGIDPTAEDNLLRFARIADGKKWIATTTLLGQDTTPLALAHDGTRWCLLARQEMMVFGEESNTDAWYWTQMVVFTSPDGRTWNTEGLPLPYPIVFPGPTAAIASGPDAAQRPADDRRIVPSTAKTAAPTMRVVAAYGSRTFSRATDGSWTASTVPITRSLSPSGQVSLAIDAHGTLCWAGAGNPPHYSFDGVHWRPFTQRDWTPSADFVWTRNGAFETFDAMMRKFGALAEVYRLYPQRRLAVPEKATPAEVPFHVAKLSGLAWDGSRLVGATDLGIIASEDGERFTLISEATVPLPSDTDVSIRGIVATSKAYWLFLRPRGLLESTAPKVLRVGLEPQATPTEVKVPIRVRNALVVDDRVVFIGTKSVNWGGELWVAWSDDDGANWNEAKLPADEARGDVHLVHGPFGWATVGVEGAVLPKPIWTLALSNDLRNWRVQPLPDAVSIRALSIGAVGENIVLHATTVADEWMPASDRLLWSQDGASWTSGAIPASWLASTCSDGDSLLRCSNGVAFLQLKNGWIYSRDLARWHPLPGFGDARSDLHEVFAQDGVALLCVHPLASEYRAKPMILRAAIADDARIQSLAGLMLPPVSPQPLGKDAVWIDQLVRWDAELNELPEKRANPIFRAGILLKRLRVMRPGRPSDNDIRLAANIVIRSLGHGFDEPKLGAALDLMSVMDDASSQPANEGSQRIIAALRTKELGQTADILLDALRGRAGEPRQLRINPVPDETKPQSRRAIADIDLLRYRAAAGDAGAAYDLSRVYDLGEGAMINWFAWYFWKQEALRLGFADPSKNEGNAFKGLLDQESNKTSMYWLLQEERKFRFGGDATQGSTQPDLKRSLWLLGEAAKLGCWEAMGVLASALYSGRGDPDELAESFRLSERAASHGDPASIALLGIHHLTGAGVERNRLLGAEYLRLSAEAGYKPGIALHAKLLAAGMHGTNGAAESEEWIKRLEAFDPASAATLRSEIAQSAATILTQRYTPEPPSNPFMDNAARLRLAEHDSKGTTGTGDPAACADVSDAYLTGAGFLVQPQVSNWWLTRAKQLGWDPDADAMSMAKNGSIAAYGEQEVINGLGDRYFDAAIAAGYIPAMNERAAMLLRSGNDTDRTGALALYRKAAAMGDSYAAIELGKLLTGTDNLPERLKYFEQASLAGDPAGHALCAIAFRQGSAWTEGDRVRVVRALLRLAGVSTTGMPDPATDPFGFYLAGGRAIKARAETGSPRAMTARGLSIGLAGAVRDDDEVDAYAWARAAALLGESTINPDAAVIGLPPAAHAVVTRIAEVTWSCALASESDLPDTLAPRRAWATNAAPGTSQTERALRTLLGMSDRGGKGALDALDDTLAGLRARAQQISQSDEPIRVVVWRELVLAAGIAAQDPLLGAKRGRELFTTLAGIPDIAYDEDAPWTWANETRKALVSMSSDSIRGIAVGNGVNVRDEFLKLLAAMQWYGIGVPPNRAQAAITLLYCKDRFTQALAGGFALTQLSEDERESFDQSIGFLDDMPNE